MASTSNDKQRSFWFRLIVACTGVIEDRKQVPLKTRTLWGPSEAIQRHSKVASNLFLALSGRNKAWPQQLEECRTHIPDILSFVSCDAVEEGVLARKMLFDGLCFGPSQASQASWATLWPPRANQE